MPQHDRVVATVKYRRRTQVRGLNDSTCMRTAGRCNLDRSCLQGQPVGVGLYGRARAPALEVSRERRIRLSVRGREHVSHHVCMGHAPGIAPVQEALDALIAILRQPALLVQHLAFQEERIVARMADAGARACGIDGDVGSLVDRDT